MPSSDTPPGWCAAATMARASRAKPSRPSSSARPSCSVRSLAVSCSSPPCAPACAPAVSDRMVGRRRPRGPLTVPAGVAVVAFLTSRWATSRSRWLVLVGSRRRRLTHVHLPMRARGVLADGASVHLSFVFWLYQHISALPHKLPHVTCQVIHMTGVAYLERAEASCYHK